MKTESNIVRPQWHIDHIAQQQGAEKKTWKQTALDAAPYVAAGAVAAAAVYGVQRVHSKRSVPVENTATPAPQAPVFAGGIMQTQNALKANALKLPFNPPTVPPNGPVSVWSCPFPTWPKGAGWPNGLLGVNMLARPPADTPAQRIAQDASDMAMDAAVGAAIGAVAGAFLTPPVGILVGILATGVARAVGKEQRGR